jgi:hypothetical protein
MTRQLFIGCILLITVCPARAQEFKNLRYDERYESQNDSLEITWYDRLKFTPLNASKKSHFSMGGEIRYQYFHYVNEDWGDAPKDDDGYILSRFLLHGDLHIGSRFRTFVQLQSSLADGQVSAPSPVDQNELDLHQAFMDFKVIDNEWGGLIFRAGRQEMSYGSSRLVSTREGPNNRHSFDGAKMIMYRKASRVDAFYSTYVFSKKGIFNDEVLNPDMKFWGVYLVQNRVPFFQNVDVYYLGIRKAHATWNDVAGVEERHSLGARIWGRNGYWTYDFEGLYQFGDIEGNSISAWTLSSNTTYTPGSSAMSPSLELKTEFISGDRRADDGRIQSFNPLFPRGAYFGYAALIGPSNLFDVHPSVDIPLARRILASVDYDFFWRYSVNDGIYNAGSQVIYPAGDSKEKFIGHQLGGMLELTVNKYVYLRVEVTWLAAGDYLKSVSAGKDILFTGLTSTIRF